MKTKLVGLAAIILALLMSVGMASAYSGYGYDMTTSITVGEGFGYQRITAIEPFDFGKVMEITIGNMNVSAPSVNMSDPAEAIDTLEKAEALVKYDPTISGMGSASAWVASEFGPCHQSKTITFGHSTVGNKTIIKQIATIPVMGYNQEFLTATEGHMNFTMESSSVTIHCGRQVTAATIYKAVDVDVAKPDEKSMLFHNVSGLSPDFDPAFTATQYIGVTPTTTLTPAMGYSFYLNIPGGTLVIPKIGP